MKNLLLSVCKHPFQSLFYLLIIGVSVIMLAIPYPQLAVIPGLGIIFIMIICRNPHFGYYTIIFLIPFGAYRGLTGPYEFIKIHWVIASILTLTIFIQNLYYKKYPESLKSNLWPLLLLFLSTSLISSSISTFPLMAFKNVLLLITAYLFISINLILISEKGFRYTMPIVLMCSVTIGSILTVVGTFFNIPFFSAEQQGGAYVRGIGGAIDPNNQSLMIIFVIPIIIHLMFQSRNSLRRFLMIAAVLINVLGVIATYSRGGFMILVLVIGLILIENRWRFKTRYLGIFIAVTGFALALILLLTPVSYWNRQKSLTAWEGTALHRRMSYLYVGWDAFKENPLLGSGSGTFRELYAKSNHAIKYERKGKSSRRYAHNTYIEILVGTGIIGLLIFIFLLWQTFKNFTQAKKTFQRIGDKTMVSLTGSYRLSFVSLMIYLMIFSDLYHKYLLLSLPLSQVAMRISKSKIKTTEYEYSHTN